MIRPTLALAALLLAAPAFAKAPDGPGPRGERMFERLDSNKDGVLTAAELGERADRLMAEADADRDGKLTKEELAAIHQARRAEHEQRMFPDADGDGVVTRSEWTKSRAEMFDDLDANKDGKLTKDELEAGRREHGPHPR